MESRSMGMMERWKATLFIRLLFGLLLIGSRGINADAMHKLAKDQFRDYEIIRPKTYSGNALLKNTLSELGKHKENIAIRFRAFKEDFLFKLKLNKDLLPSHYTERHYDDLGRAIVTKPHKHIQSQKHCFYHGKVQSLPDSLVALSTCKGISGFIHSRGDIYYIEALSRNISGDHVIYRERDRISTRNLTCGHEDKRKDDSQFHENKYHTQYKHQRLKRSLRGPYDKNSKTRFLELYVTNDYRQFLKYGSDVDNVFHRTKSIVNIVNALYNQLNIYVVLVGIEVWTKKDLILIVSNAEETMNNYLDHRKLHINTKFANDNAQLISAFTFSNEVVGKAVKGVMCTYQYSGGVSLDHTDLVGPVATTVAHEIGHNFGMEHDTAACRCNDYRCIMAATGGGSSPVHWSSCSVQELTDAFDQGLDYCLHNVPEKTFDGPMCGNGFLEDGEECDCGLPEECKSACCNATTCTLYVNATCATGQCCDQDTCQYKAATTPCRSAESQCDLPEFCTGKSEECPHDVYLQNGQGCRASGMQAYCFNGQCHSHASQCSLLWGSRSGRASIPECYKHFNPKGFSGGNCGFSWVNKTFKACDKEDYLCGLLQCDHANEKLMFWQEQLILTHPENWIMVNSTRYECKSVIMDVGLNMPDPGMVPDGAKCGENKMCVKNQCRPLSTLGIQSCAGGCDGHGVCNSRGHCHCDVGYAPPDCSSPGNGGSVDSGPIKILGTNVALIVGICLLFIVVIPLLAFIGYLTYKNREKLKLYVSVPTVNTKPPPPPVPKPKPICKALPVRSNSNVCVKPPPYNSVQRGSSFRDMEISTPVFQSSTNKNHVTRLSHVTCHDAVVRPASVMVPTSPRETLPERPSSFIVQGDSRQKANVNLSTLSEDKKSPNSNAPARPPYPKVWSTTSSASNVAKPNIPIQTRPLPELPTDEANQYYNEDESKRTESIYYNEDSEDDLDGSVDLSEVKLRSDDDRPSIQEYVNMASETPNSYQAKRKLRDQIALPKSIRQSPTNNYYNTDLKKSNSSVENRSKVNGLKKNFTEKTADDRNQTNRPTGAVKLQKKHSFSSAYANDKQYISGPILKDNAVSSTNGQSSNVNVPSEVPKHSYKQHLKSRISSPILQQSPENKPLPPPPVPSHSYNKPKPTSSPKTAVKRGDIQVSPPVPSHSPRSNLDTDNAKHSGNNQNTAKSSSKPVGKVAAMLQKFKDNDDQQTEGSGISGSVGRSASSASDIPKRTHPVARAQTNASELSTVANRIASDQRVKPPPPATKPPSLSRSVSNAGAAGTSANTDTNRKKVVRTRSNAGERPKLPQPPKPPDNKRNSSAC